MKTLLRNLTVSACMLMLAAPTTAQSLRGSPWSLTKQNRAAQAHDFTYLATSRTVGEFVEKGYLIEVPEGEHHTIANVSHPYARPEVKLFIERLAVQYRAACGQPLVITSLTRPRNDQPHNASSRSVHPTGMAVDIRRSNQRSCRNWIEDTLLELEEEGVIEATRERHPPHYHIAVFPQPYAQYVASLPDPALPDPAATNFYRVRRGDSLWSIARSYGLPVDALKQANEMSGNSIYAGQTLRIPPR